MKAYSICRVQIPDDFIFCVYKIVRICKEKVLVQIYKIDKI